MQSYRYAKFQALCITQATLNLPNTQHSVYLNVNWDFKPESDAGDIEEGDHAKILPNTGRKSFIFRPPNAQLPVLLENQQYLYLNFKDWICTESLFANDQYHLPGSITFINKTDIARLVRVVISVAFRGSRVLDKEILAEKILLKKNRSSRLDVCPQTTLAIGSRLEA